MADILKANLAPQHRHHCCGHSEANTVELSRWRCKRCGAVLERDALTLSARGFVHETEGHSCGPVLQEKAESHAALIDWLWEMSDSTR